MEISMKTATRTAIGRGTGADNGKRVEIRRGGIVAERAARGAMSSPARRMTARCTGPSPVPGRVRSS
jgi:hypothetical protein